MGMLTDLYSARNLTRALLAFCLIVRGEAFTSASFSPTALLDHVPIQQQLQDVNNYAALRDHYVSSSSVGGGGGGRSFISKPPMYTAVSPVSMLLTSPYARRAIHVRRTRSNFYSGTITRTSPPLFANGGEAGDMGPGTQRLSRQAKLAISILIDLIGMSSYALPGLGETTDLGWAPISSAMIFYLYGSSIFAVRRINYGSGLAFVEEILPGFDIIPTATIAWFLTNSEVGRNLTNAAAGKANERPSSSPSSSAPPPPPPPAATRRGAGSRKVDGDLVESGVIDVDSES